MWERGLEGEGTDVGEWEMGDSREKAGSALCMNEIRKQMNYKGRRQ